MSNSAGKGLVRKSSAINKSGNQADKQDHASKASNNKSKHTDRPKTVCKALSEAKIVLPDVIPNTKSLLGQKLLVNSFDNKKSGYQGSMPSIHATKQSLNSKPSSIVLDYSPI